MNHIANNNTMTPIKIQETLGGVQNTFLAKALALRQEESFNEQKMLAQAFRDHFGDDIVKHLCEVRCECSRHGDLLSDFRQYFFRNTLFFAVRESLEYEYGAEKATVKVTIQYASPDKQFDIDKL